MIEKWLDDHSVLYGLGFQGDNSETTLYIPLSDFNLKPKNLQRNYSGKVIVKRSSGKIIAVPVPVEDHDGKPWARWVIRKNITAEAGLLTFQYRAVNELYRLLTSQQYRGIIFYSIGDTQPDEQIRIARRQW